MGDHIYVYIFMCTHSNTNPYSIIIYRKALQHTGAEILYKIIQLEL